jgi:ATP-binding cassette, subfamily B, bacterial
MEKERLPENLKKYLRENFPDEELIVAISSDITHKSVYGDEWLIATGARLLVVTDDHAGQAPLFSAQFSAIKSITAANLVGSGMVEVETNGHKRKIIQFSDARSIDFGHVVDDIRELLEGRKHSGAAAANRRKICPICSMPIPHDMNKCLRCTDKKKTIAAIFSFSRPYSRYFGSMFIAMIASTCFGLATPYMSKLFIDVILKPDPITGAFQYGKWLPVAASVLLVSYAGQLFFSGIQERLGGRLGFKTTHDIRSAIYRKLQELSLSFFDKHQTGALLARVNQDTGELQRLMVGFLPLTLESIFMLIGVGAFLFILNWQLTLFVFIPIVATALFVKNIFPKVHRYFHRFFHRRSKVSALVNDSLSGMRVIKAFGQEDVEIDKFGRKSSDYRDAGIALVNKWSIYHPLLHFFIMVGVVIVWLVGGHFVITGQMSIGSVVAYSGYLMMFYRPVFTMTRMVDHVTNALSAAERVFDVIDTEPEIKDAPDAVSMPVIEGRIEFKNITFGYNRFDPVIKDMTVAISPNEKIGLVGKSGVGKSTIINLICRLYDVNKGEILVDGINIRDIKHSDLRRNIGIVLQETFLFNGSIYDNIAYARPGVSRDEIIAASIAANAHEFIIDKPDGYDTEVGERGDLLSGGEKQRVAIARAILRDPRILILDEATSSVDTQTEKKIQEALANLSRNRTTIAIAHRLSTLRNCDKLLVIDDGQIIESGSHAELMARQGAFYDLVKMQKELSEIIAVQE